MFRQSEAVCLNKHNLVTLITVDNFDWLREPPDVFHCCPWVVLESVWLSEMKASQFHFLHTDLTLAGFTALPQWSQGTSAHVSYPQSRVERNNFMHVSLLACGHLNLCSYAVWYPSLGNGTAQIIVSSHFDSDNEISAIDSWLEASAPHFT